MALNATDVVIVQHEYGIYDGADGGAVLDVMSLVMKREELAKLLTGHTIVQKGIWPFAIYMRATGTFDGWYAADKKGNEYGPEVVKDSGPWVVKED